MKYVYFGSSQFSASILEKLYKEKIIPTLVISQPDKAKGRGLKLSPTEVCRFAEEKSLPFINPISLKDERVFSELKNNNVDFFVVVDYGGILPRKMLSLPKILPLGIHPSMLPRYRGPAPINWTIINGDKETGTTIYKIISKVDAGDIISQKKITIDYNDNIFSLKTKLIDDSFYLLVETMERIIKNEYILTPQDEKFSSFAPKLNKNDGRINWNWEPARIRNLIRGTLGWPGAYADYQGRMIKILETDIIEEKVEAEPSTIIAIAKDGINVSAGGGVVKIKRLKPEGKKDMDSLAFICGHRVKVGDRFS